jgi:hypothetical protein
MEEEINAMKFQDVDLAFQQLKNIRTSIYKALGDIDQLCNQSDLLTKEIIQEYIAEKERISSNQMNENDDSSPFKSKTNNNSSSRDLVKVVCFPGRKREKNTRRKEQENQSVHEIKYPNLFLS